jgi:hypothetical protein
MPIWVHLVFLHLLSISWGIHAVASVEPDLASLLYSPAAGITIVLACAADARWRKSPIARGLQFIMLMGWPVAGGLYLIGSRGLRGVLWAMLWYASVIICCIFAVGVIAMSRM